MSLTFSYRREELENSIIWRPKIPIILRRYRKEVPVMALMDSGADFTLIPVNIAKYLDLEISGKKYDAIGLVKKFKTIDSRVNVEIRRKNTKISIPQMIIRICLDENVKEVILGRIPFFSKFNITFKENARKLILTKSTHGKSRISVEEKL